MAQQKRQQIDNQIIELTALCKVLNGLNKGCLLTPTDVYPQLFDAD